MIASHTTPYHSKPYHTTPDHANPYYTTPDHSKPYHTTPDHSTPQHTTPNQIMLTHTIPHYHSKSHHLTQCHTTNPVCFLKSWVVPILRCLSEWMDCLAALLTAVAALSVSLICRDKSRTKNNPWVDGGQPEWGVSCRWKSNWCFSLLFHFLHLCYSGSGPQHWQQEFTSEPSQKLPFWMTPAMTLS